MENPVIVAIISGLFGGGAIGGAIGAILVARYSRSKPERDADLLAKYLGLVDISGKEIKGKIEEISKLTLDMATMALDNVRLRGEMDDLKRSGKLTDEVLESSRIEVSTLRAQLNKDSRDRDEMRKTIRELNNRDRILWQYLVSWIEHAMRNGVKPIPPPPELESDPELMKILGLKKE